MEKALFLDRDGIVNVDHGYEYRIPFIDINLDILQVCQEAIAMGYLIIVVTNQSGVDKGFYTEANVIAVHEWMTQLFLDLRIPITHFYYCIGEDNHPNRKPNPGMILEACGDYNIDVTKSLMVGDKSTDRIDHPGLKSIILKSKYEPEDYDILTLSDIVPFLNYG